MALRNSTGKKSAESSLLYLRTSGNEQGWSLDFEDRYDFRKTTKDQRKYSPFSLNPDSIENGFEVGTMRNSSGSNRESRTSLNYSMESCSFDLKHSCNPNSSTPHSTSTPTGGGFKRKNSSMADSDQTKKRKILSSSVQEARNQSFRPGLTSRITAGKNTSWSQHNTVVQPFNFMTDKRLKNAQSKKKDKEVDFISSLRSCSARLDKFKLGVTKPKPFSFDVGPKVTKKQESPDKKPEVSKQKPHLVIPQSPNLRAVTRHRPVTVLSREQIEEMEVEEMKKWKFHAKPVDPKLFAQTGITKVEHKPSTKPEGLQLETEKRSLKRPRLGEEETTKYEFHAQPVPKRMLREPTGLKERVQLPLTEPKSPQFLLKARAQKSKENSLLEVSSVKPKIIRKPPPRSNRCPPVVPEKLSTTFEKRCTEIQPFSFEVRDKMRFERKKTKIEQVLEKEKMVPKFKANPMPIPGNSPSGLPSVQKKSPTKPAPFKLRVDHIAEKKAQKLKMDENGLSTKAPAFKAKPAAVIHKPPFQPQKSAKPLTAVNGFQLHTDKRAEERYDMEEAIKSRNAEYEAMRELLNKEKEEKEKEKLNLLRQQAVHKANPIRHYKPIVIQHSNKPLTEPTSPQFATSKRIHRV